MPQHDENSQGDDHHDETQRHGSATVTLHRHEDSQRQRLRPTLKVARKCDRGTELAEGPGPRESETCRKRRPDHRERHTPQHRPASGAERGGSALVSGVEVAEASFNGDHEERHGDEGRCDDDPPDREREHEAGHLIERLTDQSSPTQGEEQSRSPNDGWQHQGQHHDSAHD